MIATIRLTGDNRMSPAQLEQLQTVIPDARAKQPGDYPGYNKPEGVTDEEHQQALYAKDQPNPEKEVVLYNEWKDRIANVRILMERCPWVRFEVLSVIPFSNTSTPEELIHKFYEMSSSLSKAVESFNNRCNVHIGGSLLMQVTDTLLKEDCCTNELQSCLNAGWRIIAVCVQPDGRRPDYILGRNSTDG
jgi:hypothetical protein